MTNKKIKINKLRQNRDFRILYGRGKSRVHSLLVTYALRQSKKSNIRLGPGMSQMKTDKLPGASRIGITAGKKTGGAVLRNRSRRVICEAYRMLKKEVAPGWDIVFVARTRTSQVKSGQIYRVMEKQLGELGVLVRKDRLV